MRAVRPRDVAVCWAPLLTGALPGELLAAQRGDVDRDLELIYLHETADRFGRISSGTKTTHHLAEKGERGRWSSSRDPSSNSAMSVPQHSPDCCFRAHEARSGRTATSTATCGSLRRESPARTSRSMTCGIHSLPDCWRPAFRSPRLRPGWAIRSVPAALQSTPPRRRTLTSPASTEASAWRAVRPLLRAS